jgi:aminoglycoside/choline kinase family phosphotransferase
MDWPPDGQLAADDPRRKFRARDVTAFVAVAGALRDAGLSAPRILAADRDAGFLLMEDFGTEGVTAGDAPVTERYAATVDALAMLHGRRRAPVLPAPGGATHALQSLAGEALFAELGLFVDWYVPRVRGAKLDEASRAEFFAIWRDLAAKLAAAEQSWVLFDVQSANLFWLPGRTGIARVGFIDFQDMFVGPAAYDVASLVFDARVDVEAALADALVSRYLSARQRAGKTFAADSFRTALAIAGALRTMKNMGAFARFAEAGKPQYIRHLDRLTRYLSRLLYEPVLSPLALWYERHLPS